MDEKEKQAIGTVIGVGVAVGIGIGYHYYLKSKTGFGIEKIRFPKMLKSRWKIIDREYEEIDEQTEDELNNNLDHQLRTETPLRSRFTVYGSNFNTVAERFKILETHGGGEREKGRLRVSGNIYRKDTPSGYNKNNRNPVLSDLDNPNKLDIW